jgi:Ni/Fe-hydrogenase subunit HybB-like protein
MRQRSLAIAYWATLSILAALGLWAIYLRAVVGLRLTNLTSLVPWGLWVAFYIYFIGLSAGAFLVSTMIYVFGLHRFEAIGRMALFTAFVALVTGLGFILLDLGHLERFWTVFINRSPTSVLEWEIHFYTLYAVILLSELWLLMRRDLIRAGQEAGLRGRLCRLLALRSTDLSDVSAAADLRMVRILGTIGVPVAIAVHGGTGAIFAVVKARPYWYTGLFPLIFLVSALASGSALLTFLTAFFARRKDAEHQEMTLALGKLTAGFLALDLIFLMSEMLVGWYGGVPDHIATYRAMMFGPFWYVFWIGQLGLGALVPLILILNRRTGRSVAWVGMAGALIVAGILGVRLNIVIPPLTVPLQPGIDTAYPLGRVSSFALDGLNLLALRLGLLALTLAIAFLLARLIRLPTTTLGRSAALLSAAAAFTAIVFVNLRLADVLPAAQMALPGSAGRVSTLPLLFGGAVRSTDPSFYSPSMWEWLTTLGLLALAAIAFSLGWLWLPLEGLPELPTPQMRRFPGFNSGRGNE